jgi:K+-transporting ATPase ATPase A chain
MARICDCDGPVRRNLHVGLYALLRLAKKKAKPSAGTMPTDRPLFIGVLLAVVAIVTLPQYLPALALGPIAEHFLACRGATF